MLITIDQYPPSTNVIWRVARNRIIKSAAYRKWLADMAILIRGQTKDKIIGAYGLEILVKRKDRRRRDIDNFIKPISDLLVSAGVVEDDSLCDVVTAMWDGQGSSITIILIKNNLPSEQEQWT